MRSRRPILLVEDDDVDAESVRRAFRRIPIHNDVVRARHGEDALAYLGDPSKPRPCLTLLDLRMPQMDGIEFLRCLRENTLTRPIPVVIVTTSNELQDVQRSYDLGVQGYVVKPVEYTEFVEVIRAIDQYWSLCELPGE